VSSIVIPIPQELDDIPELTGDLRLFFDLMVRKLHLNRYKGFIKGKTIIDLLEQLHGEIDELHDALHSGSQFDVTLENVDCANLNFLLAFACLHRDKEEFVSEQVEILKIDSWPASQQRVKLNYTLKLNEAGKYDGATLITENNEIYILVKAEAP